MLPFVAALSGLVQATAQCRRHFYILWSAACIVRQELKNLANIPKSGIMQKMFTKLMLSAALALALTLTVQAQTYTHKAVAAVIVGEAGNQGEAGMAAVAEVIRQRCIEMKKTPTQVVLAGRNGRHAFSCLNGLGADALIRKQSRERGAFLYALGLADKLFSAPESLPNTTFKATHFTRKEEKPWWAKGHKPVVIIKDHAFYRLPKSL